ncbi:MAG: carboxypeptidase regulatory-like domain-containing protein [Acidobacteriota bacterium]
MRGFRKAGGLLAAVSFVLLLLSPAVLGAQSGSGAGSIEGSVLDPSGKPVSDAAVVIRNEANGYTRAAVSDASGRFAAASMPVGTYSVEATAARFAPQRVVATLGVGAALKIELKLSIAGVTEQLTVVGEDTHIDRVGTATSTRIDEKAVADLPIRGRNFTEFAILTPNIMQEANRGGLVVNGQRSINSNISIDGVDFNDSLQGNQRGGNDATYSFPQSAVREFQVVRSGASAEVGRTTAGFVNVVTKSGTNQISGEGFYSNRNGKLTSRDAFGHSSSNNSQHQMGGAIGGPMKRDKLFWFAAAEKNLLTIPYTVQFRTPSQPAGQPPVVVPQSILNQQGQFEGQNNPLVSFVRVDSVLSPRHSLNVQYTYSALGGLNFSVKSALTDQAVSNNNKLDRKSQGVKVALTSVLTPGLLNEVRAQYAYDNRYQVPESALPQIDIKDFGTIGGNSDGPINYKATRYELLDNVSWTRGIHSVRAGFDANYNPQYMTREKFANGLYTFATFADYLNGRIQQYQQALAAPGAKGFYQQAQQDYGAFVQDAMRLHSYVTLTAGLRWDGQVEPQPDRPNPLYPVTSRIPNDLKMWQPRLGVAYDIGGKGRSVIRLSTGLYDSRTPGYLLQRAFTDNGIDVLTINSAVDPGILNYLTVPNALAAIPAGVALPLNSIYAFDPNFRNPRSFQVAAAIEQQLGKNTKVTLGYTRNATSDLQRRVDKNLFPPTLDATGYPIYPKGPASTGGVLRPDPSIAALNVNESSSRARYNAVSFSLQRQMSHRLQFQTNYTYAVGKDDDSNERDFNRQGVLNTFDYMADWGYSRQDIRHSGNVHLLYDLPGGFTISAIALAHTGIPFKSVIGSDLQNDGNSVNDRPIIDGHVIARNALRQPDFFDADLRLLKSFNLGDRKRLTLSIEAFNLTRAPNTGMDGDGESVYGKPTATANPITGLFYANNTAGLPTTSPSTDHFGGARQVQLGARIGF